MSDSQFTSALKTELIPLLNMSQPLIIMGDFNLDISGRQKNMVDTLCSYFSCGMLIHEPTTDHMSTLDLIFSNTRGTAGVVEAYWSDHKIVYLYK